MTFLFAYLGSLTGSRDWPVDLMHQAETGFIVTAVGCVLLIIVLNGTGRGARWLRDMIAAIGGISTSLALIMPFELAPFFFGARGEIMMMSIALNLVYPIAAIALFFLFRRMSIDPAKTPPPLPTAR
jgi:thiosulfate dehydrogenase (quinone) large subunit